MLFRPTGISNRHLGITLQELGAQDDDDEDEDAKNYIPL